MKAASFAEVVSVREAPFPFAEVSIHLAGKAFTIATGIWVTVAVVFTLLKVKQ